MLIKTLNTKLIILAGAVASAYATSPYGNFIKENSYELTFQYVFPEPIAPPEGGRIFFCAINNPNAKDSNPGTRESPFKTIAKGLTEVSPGDTLYLDEGTYREQLRMTHGGEPNNPITISGLPGKKVVLSGASLLSQWEIEQEIDRPELPKAPLRSVFFTETELETVKDKAYRLPMVRIRLTDKDIISSLQKDDHLNSVHHTCELYVDGKKLVHFKAKEDIQMGSWCYDEPDHSLLVWGPEFKNVRQQNIELRMYKTQNEKKSYYQLISTPYPGTFLPPDTGKGIPDYWKQRGRAYREQLFVDEQRYLRVFSLAELQENTWFLDTDTKRIYLLDSSSINLQRRKVEISNRPYILYAPQSENIHDIILKNIHFKAAADKRSANAVQLEGSRFLIDSCSFSWSKARGLKVANGSNIIIQNSSFHHNGMLGITCNSIQNSLIDNCLFKENSYAYPAGWETGGSKFVLCKNLITRRTVACNNSGSGIWYDIENDNCLVIESVCHDNLNHSLFYEISRNGEIAYNLVYSNYYWGLDGSADLHAISGGPGISVRRSSDVLIHHNLCTFNKIGIMLHPSGPIVENVSTLPLELNDCKIYQNILVKNQLANIAFFGRSSDPDLRNQSHENVFMINDSKNNLPPDLGEYNILFGAGFSSISDNTKFTALIDFQKSHIEQEKGSSEKQIIFANPENRDWRITNANEQIQEFFPTSIEVQGYRYGIMKRADESPQQ